MRRIGFLMFVVFAWLVSAPWLRAQGQITTFDAPGAGASPGEGTLPQQITGAGAIAGFYRSADRVNHAFVRSAQGQFTTFDVPGAGTSRGEGTQALGIAQGTGAGTYTIVGIYIDANRIRHGFVRRPDGTITTFDAPGAGTGRPTIAASINLMA